VTFEHEGRILTAGEIQPQRKYRETEPNYADSDMMTVVDVHISEASCTLAQSENSSVQKLRKAAEHYSAALLPTSAQHDPAAESQC